MHILIYFIYNLYSTYSDVNMPQKGTKKKLCTLKTYFYRWPYYTIITYKKSTFTERDHLSNVWNSLWRYVLVQLLGTLSNILLFYYSGFYQWHACYMDITYYDMRKCMNNPKYQNNTTPHERPRLTLHSDLGANLKWGVLLYKFLERNL